MEVTAISNIGVTHCTALKCASSCKGTGHHVGGKQKRCLAVLEKEGLRAPQPLVLPPPVRQPGSRTPKLPVPAQRMPGGSLGAIRFGLLISARGACSSSTGCSSLGGGGSQRALPLCRRQLGELDISVGVLVEVAAGLQRKRGYGRRVIRGMAHVTLDKTAQAQAAFDGRDGRRRVQWNLTSSGSYYRPEKGVV